jgi:dTDP-4-amino-4,6-dideoxygalactose transaminase
MDETIFVTRPFLPDRAEYDEMLKRIWSNQWLTNDGPLLKELQQALKEYFGVKGLICTTNGHLALETILRGLELEGEVITTPFTFVSTTHAIVRCGLTPVFCDIRESDLTLNPEIVKRLISEKTSAILATHVYGHPCDVEALEEIAREYGVKVIYDGAHAFGVTLNGRSLASYGDATILSFHATKLFHTIEGGALVFADKGKEQRYRGHINFGIESETEVSLIGGNAKMSEFQAAMGIVNLSHIDDIIFERKQLTMQYQARLADILGIEYYQMGAHDGLSYNYAYLPIRVKSPQFGMSRDDLYQELVERNIFSRRYFYPLTCDYSCYQSTYGSVSLPVARAAAEEILCLPIYNGLDTESVESICYTIASVRENRKG